MTTTSAPPAPAKKASAPAPAPFVNLADDEPIRADLFGLEHLEAHARLLATSCHVTPRGTPGDPLLRRFEQIGEDLAHAHERIVETSARQEPITTDAEWLLDNYHIIEETLREVRQDLPRGYYKELPKLADGPFAGLPRVYALSIEVLAHTDSSLEEGIVTRFVQAFQGVTPLTIGELWAVPIMLRLGLLENLRCLAQHMLHSWGEQQKGHTCAHRLITLAQPDSIPQDPALHHEACTWSDPCIVRLLQVLRDHGPHASAATEWLAHLLAQRRLEPAEVLRREHQRQAANQVSVGNCVTSLRLLSNLDWSTFFERTSLVEALLRNDPAGVYARQDFGTKDRYRRAIETLARRSDHDEVAVANRALALARHGLACAAPEAPARGHVGYYLLGPGRPLLERDVHFRPRWRDALLAVVLDHPAAVYFGALAVVTVLLLAGLLAYGAAQPDGTPGMLVLVAFALLLPITDLAIGLVHYVLTRVLPPRVLAKLDFKEGIPADCPTFVVMPTMLVRPESAAILTDRLEVHYLSNPDPHLRFALLTDFADAPTEHCPEDEEYVRLALDLIKVLNDRYAPGGPDRFFLFHRRRQWNAGEGCWMGWERKRGKLSEFNRLLRGATDTSYAVVSGDLDELPRIRYIITLDADTQLPRETAQRLVATLAHPLNQAHFDAEQGRVVEGYGLLQPRVSLSLIAATRSLFARILASSAGIDPYTTAVSDVYQDLFGRGTFTGKGIYDVDAFEAAVGHTFPENHILSHDLIEGNYARCGLVTDIELLDDFPARYHAYARREHRWVRGDWQLLPWLMPHVPRPKPDGGVEQWSNPLPALERWKVLDNLRRSLVPPALIVLLTLGWTILPGRPWVWTVVALAVLALPLLILLVNSTVSLVRGGSWLLQLREIQGSVAATAGQTLLGITVLAEQSRQLVHAIGITLARLTVTHRRMLEWETAASTERRLGAGLGHFGLQMWGGPVLAFGIGVLVAWLRPVALPVAAPFLLAWLLSPAIAYALSRPRVSTEKPLTADERQELRRLARKTWDFFETFVTAEENYLPPDNYQEDPKGEVAPRTSPTNIGLYLLSSLAAQDLGYLTLSALVDRLEKTFDTLDRLERYHGHFYNWYSTRTLEVLTPPYVSTVDSGNLLGCLLTLRQGLADKARGPLDMPMLREGLRDTARLASEALADLEPHRGKASGTFAALDVALGDVNRLLAVPPGDLVEWDGRLERLALRAEGVSRQLPALAAAIGEPPDELDRWTGCLARQVADQRKELAALASWLPACRAGGRDRKGAVALDAMSVGLPPAAMERWQYIRVLLANPGTVADGPAWQKSVLAELPFLEALELPLRARQALVELRKAVECSATAALLERLRGLVERAGGLADSMSFKFLYNEQRHLFTIGFNREHGRLDPAHYDLLASESCLTSFLAIARGDVPKKHWFQLGRQLTGVDGTLALLSWGGTMFEYLMPRLLLPTYADTLLDVSTRGAVDRQIEYGRQNHVPWGMSESGFNALDKALDYQYQSFGVPGLGLKRGLSRDLVIAPYATALALMVRPHAALANLRALAAENAEGPYGLYEAIDYTRDRLKKKRYSAIVRSFMAHHQGMSLVALANCLLGDVMPRRFHAEPMVRATDLLLQERVPRIAPLWEPHGDEANPPPVVRDGLLPMSRRLSTPDTPHPRTQMLSNGRYTVVLTNAGAGSSTWQDLDVTRWREDRATDAWGQFCYVRDLQSGLVWSAGHQPICRPADHYEVVYATDKADFRRRDGSIETHLEVTVSPENAAEVRRLTLINHGARTHELELTSYAEIVLAPHRADLAHPAFGKLFLETEFVPGPEALLCRRRPRAADQKPIWAVHVMAVEGATVGALQYETDRGRFLGRGRTPAQPAALDPGAVLSGTTGPVLDPVVSLRRRVRVVPGLAVSIAFTTAVAATREEALVLADQYHNFPGVNRAFELAWAHTQVQLRHLHLSAEEVHLFQRLAAHVLYTGITLRAPAAVLAANCQGQPGLWRHGISGDKPIVLVTVAASDELPMVRQMLLAHGYWRLQGLEVDLVILNQHASGYVEELQEQLQNLVRASDAHGLVDKAGGIFLRKADHLAAEDKVLLQAAARVVLSGNRGSLAGQVDQQGPRVALPGALPVAERWRGEEERTEEVRSPELLFANGFGGFTPDGREYIVHTAGGGAAARALVPRRGARPAPIAPVPGLPPAPWINVVANPRFGFLVSEGGGGYTWAGNSQMNRLTPWTNDPISDPPGEVLYLRDDQTGEVWTPTPLPLGAGTTTLTRHGQGYTLFEQARPGLRQELLVFVPVDDPIKVLRLKVRNTGRHTRRLSAAFFAEWVLGTVRDDAPLHVLTEVDTDSGALLARNHFNPDFGHAVAFADVSVRPRTCTGDRTEFLGRNGSVSRPAALRRVALSGRTGATLDPCAALLCSLEVPPGQEREVVFLLGQGANVEEVRRLAERYRNAGRVQAAFEAAKARWEDILTAVQVQTPSAGMDLLLNRWLLYQVLSCRVWARSAFYQSGGAYGFRDQLQDVMALVHAAPAQTRAQLLRAAGRQFLEGDVQHWWHPPAGRGVRTRFSDDFLWLPFVAAYYVTATGDHAILDEEATFLRASPLRPEQEEEYGLPTVTEEKAPLYEHCVRALDHGLRYGAHGLPLMGTGDWNDGMNRVGAEGKGESVWDGWFQLAILPRFADLAEQRGDAARASRYREEAQRLRSALEEQAWDGGWYRRAYFDDGTPLGSAQNDECQIDSLPQSWAVISGAANPARARAAMAAVDRRLVRAAEGLILLFTPPFDRGQLQPGYIKGYVPGIRENGGQYTHAATWVVQATAMLGQGKRALELFDLLSPVTHTSSPAGVARYRVEPYVVAADVYGVPPHVGRGGWTWYTGSASWLYRVGLESILGFHREGDHLRLDPRISPHWPRFALTYRYGSSMYHIQVENPRGVEQGVKCVTVDGAAQADGVIPLADDGRRHEVRVEMG